jgi:hypothetical protein
MSDTLRPKWAKGKARKFFSHWHRLAKYLGGEMETKGI